MLDPATHPRLRAATAAPRHIPEVLAPGLAAEAIEALRLLPAGPHCPQPPHGTGLHWRCDAALPETPYLQSLPALIRLQRAVNTDLPALASAALGVPLRPAAPNVLSLWRFHKGSWYHDDGGPNRYIVELTGAQWPLEWGGALYEGDRWRPLGWDRLTILPEGEPLRVSLVQRHVAAFFLYGELSP